MPKNRFALAIVTLFLAIAFACLSVWQWQRGLAKQAMVEANEKQLRERKAESLATQSLSDATRLQWVAGSGHFLDTPWLLLDNQRRGAAVGIKVYRVFLPEGGRPLLVDLGWLPLPQNRKMPTLSPLSSQRQTLRGLLASPPSPGLPIGPAFDPANADYWLLMRMELPSLQAAMHLSLAPRVLRLDPALPLGFERDLQQLPNTVTPERHRAYAWQWAGLSALATCFAMIFIFRKKAMA